MKSLDFIGFDKYAACSSGRIYSIRSSKYLEPVRQSTGYFSVTLSQDGRRNNFMVHRLIALAYLNNNDLLPVVNHKNGIKSDNRLSNLEWMTHQENVHHAIDTGLRVGTRNPDRSLDDETVHKICQLLEDNWRNKDISELLGVDHVKIGNIRFGKDYDDISCQYNVKGTLPSRRKISTEKLIKICEMLQDKIPMQIISKEIEVSSATVSKIKNRKSGIYISKNYKF